MFADLHIDMYIGAYADAVTAAGGVPVHLPQGGNAEQVVSRLDGLLLSGGADIAPSRYGAAVEAELYGPEPERDVFELAVVEATFAAGIPVLGICRGLQLLNVHAGGTLHQHVPDQVRNDLPVNDEPHEVIFDPGSRLYEMYGPRRSINSLHHQTVRDLGAGWRVVGRGPEGHVEAIEHASREALAVQWHPELLDGAPSDPLFAWLVDRARG